MSSSGFQPNPDRLLPELTLKQQMVLLARTLWREGYNDHLAGHITVNLHDGTLLCNPWMLLWNEIRPEHIIRIDMDGKLVEGDWPVPPGIPLHLELHKARPGVEVALHNHPLYGTVWADMGEIPPALDQSSVLGGGEITLVREYGGSVDDPGSDGASGIARRPEFARIVKEHDRERIPPHRRVAPWIRSQRCGTDRDRER
ncbi:MAG: class II aldolase/adducin family protein [Actinobacteria bacterium]|nr:class II aldolase/adducin family protein [Actinomycetota bacterium]